MMSIAWDRENALVDLTPVAGEVAFATRKVSRIASEMTASFCAMVSPRSRTTTVTSVLLRIPFISSLHPFRLLLHKSLSTLLLGAGV